MVVLEYFQLKRIIDSMNKIIPIIKNNKSIALLAPAFPIDFAYPNIIGMLRALGFDQVTELTYGARMVNWHYVDYIKNNPDQELYIASPCPNVVAFVKAQYPEYAKYLMPIVSPMLATARIYKQHHPDSKVVFISPCFAKQSVEAPLHKEFIDEVITFTELKQIFEEEKIFAEDYDRDYFFDSFIREFTKVYPVSGGLGNTAHLNRYFKTGEIVITDTVPKIKEALEEIKSGKKKYRFLDVLNCKGGCIGGPAIFNKDYSTEHRESIIKKYIIESSEHNLGTHEGTVEYAKDVDLGVQL